METPEKLADDIKAVMPGRGYKYAAGKELTDEAIDDAYVALAKLWNRADDMEKIQRKLEELEEEGWFFKISALEESYWLEREGSAKDFLHELLICGTTNISIEWIDQG